MFVGQKKRTVDEKWRVPLPEALFDPKYEGDRDTLYFTPAGDRLLAFTSDHFHRVAESLLKRASMADPETRRRFFGNTFPKNRDKNGRIQVPEELRPLCGFSEKQEVLLLGMGPHLEILPVEKAPAPPKPEEMVNLYTEILLAGGGE
jgi:DNA-binding transcriptional regulator/RsmH inhibitor MraZ